MSIQVSYDPTTGLQHASGLPKEGELFEFTETGVAEGHGKSPNGCRACYEGSRHWVSSKHVEEVARVIYWADNSIEIYSVTGKMAMPVPPNGDACF